MILTSYMTATRPAHQSAPRPWTPDGQTGQRCHRHPATRTGQGCRLGLACLDLARHTGSARISKELHTLDAALMARWPDQPDTRSFHDALAAG
jgi:hypothetical protein